MFKINEELLTEKEWARNIDNFTVKKHVKKYLIGKNVNVIPCYSFLHLLLEFS